MTTHDPSYKLLFSHRESCAGQRGRLPSVPVGLWQGQRGVGPVNLALMLYVLGALLPAAAVGADQPRDCPAAMSDARDDDTRKQSGMAAFAVASAESLLPAERVSRDPGCYRSAQDIERAAAKGGVLLLDVRDPSAFARLRIVGSLNMAPRALATKAFLRARPIVLIDTGRAYSHLEGLCRSLRAAGFAEVSILDGGLNAWRAQVGALEGDARARHALGVITAAEFFQERRYAHWVVVDLDRAGDNPGAGRDENDQRVTVDAVRERLMRAAAGARAQGLEPHLLAVTANGAGLEAFQEALEPAGASPRPGDSQPGAREARGGEAADPGVGRGLPQEGLGPMNAFFLEGGRAGFERFLRSQRAMLGYRHRIPNRKGCGRVD